LKNAANSSGKDDKRDRCRQRGAILSPQFTRIRFSVHMAMESGCHRCEQDACTFELRAALPRAAHRATRPGCGVKFQCPSRKDPFEARMRISSQHSASAATALSLEVIRSTAQHPDRAGRVDLRANSAPRASFLYRGAIKGPRANVAYEKETEVTCA
jgi:hypothetical protein